MKKVIILRHDFDHPDGLDSGVSKMFDIERKYDVASTTFLRFDRGVSDDKYARFYAQMQGLGWEFGLHLANHENKPQYSHPLKELSKVRSLGLNIYGVAACGSNYRWHDPKGWMVQDSLGLNYICPSSLEKPKGYVMKTRLAPNHVTLDGTYMQKYGDKCMPILIKEFTDYLDRNGVMALLAHNTWFYQVKACDNGQKLLNGEYYDAFIKHFAAMPDKYEFMTYKKYLGL